MATGKKAAGDAGKQLKSPPGKPEKEAAGLGQTKKAAPKKGGSKKGA